MNQMVKTDNLPSKELPSNFEAEQKLLSAVLLANKNYEKVSDFLSATHFHDPINAAIYETAGKLIERGREANITSVEAYLENNLPINKDDLRKYLLDLTALNAFTTSADEYGKLVYDASLRRTLIGVGGDIITRAFRKNIDEGDAETQLEKAEQELYNLATSGEADRGFMNFPQALAQAITYTEAAYKSEGKISGLPTELIDLDEKLGGLHPSDLIVVAARPGMGKTAFATTLAFNIATAAISEEYQGNAMMGPVAFFSLEMSSDQLASRILSTSSHISAHKMRTGYLKEDDFRTILETSKALERLPIYIDDTPGVSIAAIRARARRLKRSKGLGLIIVDYIQLIAGSSTSGQSNRVQEVSEITRGLKVLAKELNVPVIALSQLSRAVENREDKKPQLADLRESGSIEQDADVVMFLYREDYYLEREEPTDNMSEKYLKWKEHHDKIKGISEIIIGKQRHGPTGVVKVRFVGENFEFRNLETRPE
jgi:replicative DNA helicase